MYDAPQCKVLIAGQSYMKCMELKRMLNWAEEGFRLVLEQNICSCETPLERVNPDILILVGITGWMDVKVIIDSFAKKHNLSQIIVVCDEKNPLGLSNQIRFLPSAVTPELLRRCFDAFYVPSNMALVIMGDVDAEAAARLAQECLPPDFSPPPARPCGEAEPACAFRHRTCRKLPVSQPVFSIGFRAEPSAEPLRQELTGQLAAELLLGESSALYESLYTRGLIDADFSSGFTRVPGAAFLQVSGAGCDPEVVLEAILQAPKTGFVPTRFERLKKSVRGRLLRELDGFESTCYRICEAYFAGAGCFDELAALQAVTLREAESFLRRTVAPARAAISIVCPGK